MAKTPMDCAGIGRRPLLAAAALGLGSWIGAEPAHAATPTVTVVDTVSGPNFQAFWKTYLIPTMRKNLGIDVRYALGTGPTLQLQMKSWKEGAPEFTLLFIKGLDLSNMVTAGIPLQPMVPAEQAVIPNLSMEPSEFLASNNGVALQGKGVLFWRAQFDMIYNSKFISNPPKTWKEFFDRRKEFAGHIGLIRPDAGSGGGRAFIYSFLSAFGVDFTQPFAELQNSAAWKSAWADFTEFSKYLAQPVAPSPPVMFHQFQTEQVWITDYAQDYSLWSASQGQLPPTTKAAPLDKNIIGASNAWLAVPAVASAEQKALAYKVINALISSEVQLHMLETMYQYPGTNAWQQAPASAWEKIPPVDKAEAGGIRMTNLDAITYIQQKGMDHIAH
jgi:putative spermidine/putrescine transport system substrate-binding protein